MTTTHTETPIDLGDAAFSRALRHSVWWTSVAWIVTIGIGTVAWLTLGGPARTTTVEADEALVLAVASLLIAYGSLLPLKLGRDDRVDGVRADERALASRRASRLVAGVMIRLLGTVALFLTCRYHMASSLGVIAAMTIGWYVLLTSIEVVVVARELPRPVGESAGTRSRLTGSASSLEV